MAQLADIQKVEIGPENMVATVRIADGAPLNTSEDVEATARVYWLMPQIATHGCYGDEGETFRDVMGDTELAHLLEHMTIELMAQTNLAGDISCGRTRAVGDRTWEISLACPDDVLTCGALSSAAWVLQWAFGGAPADQEPDIEGIVQGLQALVETADGQDGQDAAPVAEEAAQDVVETVLEDVPAEETPEAPREPEAAEPVTRETEEDAGEDVVETVVSRVGTDVVETTDVTTETAAPHLGNTVGFMAQPDETQLDTAISHDHEE